MIAVVVAGLGSNRIRTNPARANWRISRSAVIRAMACQRGAHGAYRRTAAHRRKRRRPSHVGKSRKAA